MNHCVPSVAVTLGNDTVFDSWNKLRRDTCTNFSPEFFKKEAISKLHTCADIALALHHFDKLDFSDWLHWKALLRMRMFYGKSQIPFPLTFPLNTNA